jgi:hypothetical protein
MTMDAATESHAKRINDDRVVPIYVSEVLDGL